MRIKIYPKSQIYPKFTQNLNKTYLHSQYIYEKIVGFLTIANFEDIMQSAYHYSLLSLLFVGWNKPLYDRKHKPSKKQKFGSRSKSEPGCWRFRFISDSDQVTVRSTRLRSQFKFDPDHDLRNDRDQVRFDASEKKCRWFKKAMQSSCELSDSNKNFSTDSQEYEETLWDIVLEKYILRGTYGY